MEFCDISIIHKFLPLVEDIDMESYLLIILFILNIYVEKFGIDY